MLGLLQIYLGIVNFITPKEVIKEKLDEPLIAFGHTIFLLFLAIYNFKSNSKEINNSARSLSKGLRGSVVSIGSNKINSISSVVVNT